MGEGVLIEMMDVRYAKVQRSHEDENGLRGRGPNQKVQREQERAKQDLLGEGTGDVVAPSDPTAHGLIQVLPCGPLSPSGFDDALFEEGPGEEKCSER